MSAKKKTEIVETEIVETPKVEEFPKKYIHKDNNSELMF
jgi:hypothetical protein